MAFLYTCTRINAFFNYTVAHKLYLYDCVFIFGLDFLISMLTSLVCYCLTSQDLLSTMSADTFGKHVEALATKRLEKAKKLTSQNNRYWGEIESQQYNFDRGTQKPHNFNF